MPPVVDQVLQSRRDFLATSAGGVGLLAVAEMLRAESPSTLGHFAARAKNCICIYLEGGPSQMDLFDPKPKLNQMHGQKLPESMLQTVRFAFI